MYLFTSHGTDAKRWHGNFNLPTHPLCWLRGHRAKVEVVDSKYVESWLLVTCRVCGLRHQDPYLTGDRLARVGITEAEAKRIIASQIDAARSNNAGFAEVRDGRDGYGHRTLELSVEVPARRAVSYRTPGIHLHIGDRWSETPFDGSLHAFGRSVYFSVGGVGNRLADRLTAGRKADLRVGAGFRDI